MKIAGYDFPDSCPERCMEINHPVDMQSSCFRCPVLNCRMVDGVQMLSPNDIPADVAEPWFEYLAQFFEEPRKKQTEPIDK